MCRRPGNKKVTAKVGSTPPGTRGGERVSSDGGREGRGRRDQPQVDEERERRLPSGVYLDCNIRGPADVIAFSGACSSKRSPSVTFSQVESDEPQKLQVPQEEQGDGQVRCI